MKSCQEYLSEVREKLLEAEDQLRTEKKNLYRTDEAFSEEKSKWAKEIKAEQVKIHANEKEIKKKEAKVEEMKAEYERTMRKCVELDGENEKLKKDIQKAKKNQQEETNKYLLEIGRLEKELTKIQEQQKDVRVSNKWAKVFQEKEIKTTEADNENKLKEEIRILGQEFMRKIEAFDENLKDIERSSLKPRQQKLSELLNSLELAKSEVEEMEKKNKELEEQIQVLEKLHASS